MKKNKDESVLQEKVFEKLFNQAEVAKLNPEELRTYDESLKLYWDNYSVIETTKHEEREQGRQEGREEGLSIDQIARITGLSKEQIVTL